MLHSQLILNGNLTHEWRLALLYVESDLYHLVLTIVDVGCDLWHKRVEIWGSFYDTIENLESKCLWIAFFHEAEEPLMAHNSWWQNLLAKCT